MLRYLIIVLFLLLPYQVMASSNDYPASIKNKENIDLREDIPSWKLIEIFTLKQTTWEKTHPSTIKIYLPDNRLVMNRFCANFLNMPFSKYKNIIQSNIYQGKARKPEYLPSSTQIITKVYNHNNVIGVIREGIFISKDGVVQFIEVGF